MPGARAVPPALRPLCPLWFHPSVPSVVLAHEAGELRGIEEGLEAVDALQMSGEELEHDVGVVALDGDRSGWPASLR